MGTCNKWRLPKEDVCTDIIESHKKWAIKHTQTHTYKSDIIIIIINRRMSQLWRHLHKDDNGREEYTKFINTQEEEEEGKITTTPTDRDKDMESSSSWWWLLKEWLENCWHLRSLVAGWDSELCSCLIGYCWCLQLLPGWNSELSVPVRRAAKSGRCWNGHGVHRLSSAVRTNFRGFA